MSCLAGRKRELAELAEVMERCFGLSFTDACKFVAWVEFNYQERADDMELHFHKDRFAVLADGVEIATIQYVRPN
jgi:hypothetical protein